MWAETLTKAPKRLYNSRDYNPFIYLFLRVVVVDGVEGACRARGGGVGGVIAQCNRQSDALTHTR